MADGESRTSLEAWLKASTNGEPLRRLPGGLLGHSRNLGLGADFGNAGLKAGKGVQD